MLLFYFVLFLNAINCQIKRQPLFKCEHNDYDETHPLPNRLVKQDVSSKRRNEGEETPEFEDFNIYLDFANLEEDMKKLNMESQKDFFENAMKKAVDTLTTLLKVKPLAHRNDEEGYNLADEDLKKLNLTKWNESLFGKNFPKSRYKFSYIWNFNYSFIIYSGNCKCTGISKWQWPTLCGIG